jgi:hypothetical protein
MYGTTMIAKMMQAMRVILSPIRVLRHGVRASISPVPVSILSFAAGILPQQRSKRTPLLLQAIRQNQVRRIIPRMGSGVSDQAGVVCGTHPHRFACHPDRLLDRVSQREVMHFPIRLAILSNSLHPKSLLDVTRLWLLLATEELAKPVLESNLEVLTEAAAILDRVRDVAEGAWIRLHMLDCCRDLWLAVASIPKHRHRCFVSRFESGHANCTAHLLWLLPMLLLPLLSQPLGCLLVLKPLLVHLHLRVEAVGVFGHFLAELLD